jgi:hypothetical protein
LKRSAREKKPNLKDDLGYVEAKNKCKDPKLLEVSRRCEKIIFKLRKHQFADLYFNNTENIPNILDVEKKVKLYQYTSIHSFAVDIRNIWKYYFTTSSSSSPDLYQKTVEMSQYFEEIFSEIEEMPIENPSSLDHITKKIKSLEDQLQISRGIRPNVTVS